MKLKLYTQAEMPIIVTNDPMITISLKRGEIRINQATAKLIGLKKGDHIVLVNDEAKPKDWYLIKSNAEQGFQLRNRDSMTSLGFYNVNLVRMFFKKMNNRESTVRLKVSNQSLNIDGLTLYPIITAPIYKESKF